MEKTGTYPEENSVRIIYNVGGRGETCNLEGAFLGEESTEDIKVTVFTFRVGGGGGGGGEKLIR